MVLPAMVLTAAISLYPLVRGFLTSLQAGGPITGVPEHYAGLQNYRDVLADPETKSAAMHTVMYLVVAVGLELAAGLAIAVALHRAFRGRGLVLAVLVLPWALPSVVSGVLWRRILDPDSGLLNGALLKARRDRHAARLAVERLLGDLLHQPGARVGDGSAHQPHFDRRPAEHPRRGLQRLGRRRGWFG